MPLQGVNSYSPVRILPSLSIAAQNRADEQDTASIPTSSLVEALHAEAPPFGSLEIYSWPSMATQKEADKQDTDESVVVDSFHAEAPPFGSLEIKRLPEATTLAVAAQKEADGHEIEANENKEGARGDNLTTVQAAEAPVGLIDVAISFPDAITQNDRDEQDIYGPIIFDTAMLPTGVTDQVLAPSVEVNISP